MDFPTKIKGCPWYLVIVFLTTSIWNSTSFSAFGGALLFPPEMSVKSQIQIFFIIRRSKKQELAYRIHLRHNNLWKFPVFDYIHFTKVWTFKNVWIRKDGLSSKLRKFLTWIIKSYNFNSVKCLVQHFLPSAEQNFTYELIRGNWESRTETHETKF